MRLAILLLAILQGIVGQVDIDPEVQKTITELWPEANVGSKPQTTARPGAPVFQGTTLDCICVPYYNCDPDTNTIIRDGKIDGFGVIDIRFGQGQGEAAKKCDHYLDVCCNEPPEAPIDTDPVGPPIEVTSHRPPPPTGPPVTTPPPIEGPVKCGIRNPEGLEFKISGNSHGESEYGEFPWMVAIIRKDYSYDTPQGDKNLALCGGSLINEHVVLTAAHCVDKYPPDEIKIRAGEWDTQTGRERYPYQERDVAQVIIHERFSPKTVFNDIALVILQSPVKYANNVKPVCLPRQGEIFSQRECYVTGWGKTYFGKKGSLSVILKKIDLPMVDHRKCENDLRKTRLGKHFKLDESFVCAGGIEGKDACTGDGGGPLICPKGGPNRYEQAGIVAWGIGCGQKDVPGVYANVALYRNWVDAHMKKLGFGTSSYSN